MREDADKERLRRQNAYMAALHETAVGILGRLEIGELLNAIIYRASELSGISDAYLYVFDPEKNVLEMQAATGDLNRKIGAHMQPGEGVSGRAWEQLRPFLINDYQNWSGRSQNPIFSTIHSAIGVPLRSASRAIGVLGLAHHQPGKTIDEDMVPILERFAELAAIAFDNARLYSSLASELKRRQDLEEERRKMESQLLQAQKMESLGTLAGGIAHDFNNLLMGIHGCISLMKLDIAAGDPNLNHLKGIEQYVRTATNLTRQLLGFARRGKYEVKSTDVNELLRETSELFGRTKKEIRIHKYLQPALWPVMMDRSQIQQVLLNLFVNSWQAMPNGGELFLETANEDFSKVAERPLGIEPKSYVRITVTDTGVGMDESVLERIYDPFFTTKEMGRGTGLGLASAYGIIRNHDGMIRASSRVGQGSTFHIFLPASDQPAFREIDPPKSPVRGNETVLLVDDEELVLEVGRKMLERLGYRVKTASGGREALAFYGREQGNVDLVILDMVMPAMSGAATFKQLKHIDKNVRVLLSSGYSMNGEAEKILKDGVRGFLQKPFDLETLSRKIREVIDASKTDGS